MFILQIYPWIKWKAGPTLMGAGPDGPAAASSSRARNWGLLGWRFFFSFSSAISRRIFMSPPSRSSRQVSIATQAHSSTTLTSANRGLECHYMFSKP